MGGRRRQPDQPIRLGTAFYDRGRCLPWAMATDCIVCEEWCPVSPKAIYVQEAQVIDSAGNMKTLKQPRVDPSRCVGCGACEYACPLQEHPAVYVTSIGESRSPSSQILLSRVGARYGWHWRQPARPSRCAQTPWPPPSPAAEAKKAKSDPFPASGAVAGWQKSGETRTFAARNLYEYIDGDAEEYIAAGVVTTSTSDYKYQGQLEATVDVYTMGDAAGARKIMENGQIKDAKTVKLGDAGIALCAERRLSQRPVSGAHCCLRFHARGTAGSAGAGAWRRGETVNTTGRKRRPNKRLRGITMSNRRDFLKVAATGAVRAGFAEQVGAGRHVGRASRIGQVPRSGRQRCGAAWQPTAQLSRTKSACWRCWTAPSPRIPGSITRSKPGSASCPRAR